MKGRATKCAALIRAVSTCVAPRARSFPAVFKTENTGSGLRCNVGYMMQVVATVVVTTFRWFIILFTSLAVCGSVLAARTIKLYPGPGDVDNTVGAFEGMFFVLAYAVGPAVGVSLVAALVRRGLFVENDSLFRRFLIGGVLVALVVAVILPAPEGGSQL